MASTLYTSLYESAPTGMPTTGAPTSAAVYAIETEPLLRDVAGDGY